MMRREIYILGIVALFLAGCYDDKGNYDYKNVNDLTIAFTPEATSEREDYSYIYRYKQPPMDTLRVTYTSVITQSNAGDESNLEYLWTVSSGEGEEKVVDSVYTKELLLKYAPKKATNYSVIFRVKDVSTQIEYYRGLTMNTVVPYVNSWFVLNGPEGDRKLSVIEEPNDEATALISLDAYHDLWGQNRFQKATDMTYVSAQNSEYTRWESLTLVQPDSVSWLYAYELSDSKPSRILFPSTLRTKYAYGAAHTLGRYVVVVDRDGKFYHAGLSSFYYMTKTQPDVENYAIDKLYVGQSGFVILWDKQNKKLMYYDMRRNNCYRQEGSMYPAKDDGNNALLTIFPNGSLGADEWSKNEILWIGQGITPASEEIGGTMIGKETATSTYNIYYVEAGKGDKGGDENSDVAIRKIKLENLNVDARSSFATSTSYADQLFYSKESKVYLYNTITKESIELYDAGALISKIQFRVSSYHYNVKNENRCIGVIVNKADGSGELHEIFLSEGGDFEKVIVHTGFGTIQNIAYSFVTREI